MPFFKKYWKNLVGILRITVDNLRVVYYDIDSQGLARIVILVKINESPLKTKQKMKRLETCKNSLGQKMQKFALY